MHDECEGSVKGVYEEHVRSMYGSVWGVCEKYVRSMLEVC